MSTRYVWDKTIAKNKFQQTTSTHDIIQGPFAVETSFKLGNSYSFDEDTGDYSISGGRTYTASDFYDDTTKKIEVSTSSAMYVIGSSTTKAMWGALSGGYTWRLALFGDGGDVEISSYRHIEGQEGYAKYVEYYHRDIIGSGEHVEYLAGSTSNAYKAGVDSTGQYYLVYLGADSIDPKSVSFSGAGPDSDGNMSVVVTPAANTLGGNILYQYQYSIDNGSNWTNAGDKTEATTKEIHVPPEAEKFMVRVQASDDIGFTSTTYVSTANITVQVMRLWVGADNVARKGTKLWVGVGGTARQVVRGWVGDENGKARRWF